MIGGLSCSKIDSDAKELETTAMGLRFFASVSFHSGETPSSSFVLRSPDVRITDDVRRAFPQVDLLHWRARANIMSLTDVLTELRQEKARFIGWMRILAAAIERSGVPNPHLAELHALTTETNFTEAELLGIDDLLGI